MRSKGKPGPSSASPPRWTIASARQQLPALISSAAREPQAVYRRNELVATVVGAELGRELDVLRASQRRPPMADALAELRRICEEEGYELPDVPRHDRAPPGPRAQRPRRRAR